MDEYEIRFFKDESGSISFKSMQSSDFCAIRRAMVLAKGRAAIEVWRGMDCIYKRGIEPPPPLAAA